jgi:hypothetical protein
MKVSSASWALSRKSTFKEWYTNNNIEKIEPIDAILKRYPVQALKNQIDTINLPYHLAFMQHTHHPTLVPTHHNR